MSGLPHIEFWPFLGLPHSTRFFRQFWADELFQLLEALLWPKRRPKILNFYPTRNFGHFWAALSKMFLNYSKFLGRLRRHTQCPLSLVSSSVCCFLARSLSSLFLCVLGVWGFRGSGVLGFRCLGFGCLGFGCSGFGCSGFGCLCFRFRCWCLGVLVHVS